MKKLEEKYLQDMDNIQPAKQILREQWGMQECRERREDASIKYPSYGRGLEQPQMDLNTYMINPGFVADSSQKKRQSSGSGSPKAGVAAQQRKRILSPKRQKFESLFERYITKKLVDDKLVDAPPPQMDFDTTTKPEGTLNAKVNQKLTYIKD